MEWFHQGKTHLPTNKWGCHEYTLINTQRLIWTPLINCILAVWPFGHHFIVYKSLNGLDLGSTSLIIFSPHHCVEFLFFAWIPPLSSIRRRRRAAHSLTHSLTHSVIVAGAVHRASWRSCGARGRRWPAAGCRVAGAAQKASWLPFAWQAQYTEPPGGAAARVGAAGPRLAVAWQAQHRKLPGCLLRGRRSTQSLLEELRRAWAPLARGWLSRGRRSTESFLAAFCVAGAVHRASWRSCGTRGRRWPAAGCRVAGAVQWELPGSFLRGRRSTQSPLEELRRVWAPLARGWLSCGRQVQRASWVPFAWQAQYTEPPGGAAARAWAPLARGWLSRGRRSTVRASWLLFAWQAQYTEPSGGASARVAAAGAAAAFRSLIASHFPHLTHHISLTTSHISLITSHLPLSPPLLTSHLSHHNFSSQLITTYHIPTHHSSTSHTTSHTSLITSELITAPLLTPHITSPLFTPHFSHLPEVHIQLRYTKAWHVGLSGPFIHTDTDLQNWSSGWSLKARCICVAPSKTDGQARIPQVQYKGLLITVKDSLFLPWTWHSHTHIDIDTSQAFGKKIWYSSHLFAIKTFHTTILRGTR